MARLSTPAVLLIASVVTVLSNVSVIGFTPRLPSSVLTRSAATARVALFLQHGNDEDQNNPSVWPRWLVNNDMFSSKTRSGTAMALALFWAIMTSPFAMPPAHATTSSQDSGAIVGCLFQKCALPLGECILNPKCLLNVACINTCTGRPDEINCQIECGNLFENDVVGKFNKCAISDMSCVPRQADDGSYPVPAPSAVVPTFDTKLFNGRWYITAGQNKLFDTFPCQVHFFTETQKGQFFGKLNWRIQEPDGEFFTRDALQEFVQDPAQPGHLVNDNNEYLHYSDQWWIIDYEYDNNPNGVPPFAFVYYRGSNDAWCVRLCVRACLRETSPSFVL